MNVYQMITQKITDKLLKAEETGEIFYWVKPFDLSDEARFPCNYETHVPYRGINRLLCESNDEYLTFNQIKHLNEKNPDDFYHLRKGSVSTPIVYFDFIDKKDKDGNLVLDENGNNIKIPLIKYYNVFSRQDVINKDEENLPSRFNIEHFEHNYADREILEISRFGHMVHTFCEKHGIDIQYVKDGTKAFFSPHENIIQIPDFQCFPYIYDYISTISHELCHATGMLNGRITPNELTTLEDYAKEELVAEIGANLLCSNFRLRDDRYKYNNDVAYLQSWRKYITENSTKNVLLSAAQDAQKAVDLIYDRPLQLQIIEDLKKEETSSYEDAEFYLKADIQFTKTAFEICPSIIDFIPEEIFEDIFDDKNILKNTFDISYLNDEAR